MQARRSSNPMPATDSKAKAALANFEDYHGLQSGTASLAQVERSSAGLEGWAAAGPHRFDPQARTLEHATDDAEENWTLGTELRGKYDFGDKPLLGEGTFGWVWQARRRSDGLKVAIKEMKPGVSAEEGVPSTAIREIAVLKELQESLHHENLVHLLDVTFGGDGRVVLIFEFVEQDLKGYMRALDDRLSAETVRNFSRQLLTGVEFCHSQRIIHRDLKPQNLLIAGGSVLKIADFGLARAFSLPLPVYTHEVVTVWYRPPEILLGSKKYSVAVDIWGAACIMGEMASGAPLFMGDSEIDTCFKIFNKLGTPTEDVWPGVLTLPDFKPTFPQWRHRGWENIRNIVQQVGQLGTQLLDEMFQYIPSQRISARRALEHSYFIQNGAV